MIPVHSSITNSDHRLIKSRPEDIYFVHLKPTEVHFKLGSSFDKTLAQLCKQREQVLFFRQNAVKFFKHIRANLKEE
jgi:hypothetical protein